MNKIAFVSLGSGFLLLLTEFFHRGGLTPAHTAVMVLLMFALAYLAAIFLSGRRNEKFDEALEAMRDEQRLRLVRRDVMSKIPKNLPRGDSAAAFEGSAKLGAARSMAALVRKPRLREKILEICDFADMVIETIRRMPRDTPAAVTFAEQHLSNLNEALERCFEMNRQEEYRNAPASLDAQEIECFSTFITSFKKQQDSILMEGKS